MIRIGIVVRDNQIHTVFDMDEDRVTLNDAALAVYELERIKRELLDLEFEDTFKVEGGGEP